MFTLSQLESFVAVAETLHYGRAADRLSITQPPLSRRIQSLERELGVDLFDRAGRGVTLTPAGRALLGDARRILGLSDQAALSVRRALVGESGSVTLGFTGSSAHSVLDSVVGAARNRLPGIDLVLRERVSGSQLEELRSGGLDLGLLRPPVPAGAFEAVLVQREPLILAVPEAHPLASPSATPNIGDLDDEALVMYSPAEARYFYELLVSIFRDAGIAPRYVQHISQVHTILALVKAGLGLALVPAAAAAMAVRGVVLKEVDGIEARPVELFLTWRSSETEPPVLAIRNLVVEELRGS
ncbi:LysR family transcriptional regulator [Gordonia soli]|uniref:Putative LysR family transcriptional regulator n=1 Tax=Gordonia soli NBRC 108243 TaxID=1223545 RepID=M0QPU0_9ACTN|nr:LysR family transcriptional regulator [Gordonia soli]GAC70598.1 putative LysR family transcriptional regulator [Gordonia soli NBRC 108243]